MSRFAVAFLFASVIVVAFTEDTESYLKTKIQELETKTQASEKKIQELETKNQELAGNFPSSDHQTSITEPPVALGETLSDTRLYKVTVLARSELLDAVPEALCSQWRGQGRGGDPDVSKLCGGIEEAKNPAADAQAKAEKAAADAVKDKSEIKKEPCPATCTSVVRGGPPGSKQCNFGAWWKQQLKDVSWKGHDLEKTCPDGAIGVGGVFVDDVNKGGMCVSWDETAEDKGCGQRRNSILAS